MTTRLHPRQIVSRSVLQHLFPYISNRDLETLLLSVDKDLEMPLRVDASSTPDLTVTIGPGVVSNTVSGRQKSLPYIDDVLPGFSSGTIVFPSVNGGTISVTPGTNTTLICPVNEYVKVLVSLDSSGQLVVTVGVSDPSEANAVVPSPVPNTFSVAYISLFNNAGVMDGISQNKIFQFGSGGSGSSGAVITDIVSVPDLATSITVTLPVTLPDTNYGVFWSFINVVDPSPQFQPAVVTNRTTTGFTLTWNTPVDSANYLLAYSIPGVDSTNILVLPDNSVNNTKLAQMPAYTIKGNNTGSAADADDLTGTEVTALLDEFVGDSGSGGVKGLVPAPAAGDAAAEKFLHADGTFKTPAVSGTVEMFTSDDTWVVPAGITSILVDGSGGGGGGAASQNVNGHGGGGGGGGSYYPPILIEVVPGNTLAITIGLGGAAGLPGGPGVAGGNTLLVDSTAAQTLAIFKGGDGGLAGSNPAGGLGGRGYGEGGDGGTGANGGGGTGQPGGYNDSNYLYQGGIGGSPFGSNGGAGGGGAGFGDGGDPDSGAGSGYGSGGGGRRAAAGPSDPAGPGSDGFLRIRW